MKFTQKYKLTILGIREDVSKIKAIAALKEIAEFSSIRQSKYFVDHLPQSFAVTGCESFDEIIMSEDEVNKVEETLTPFFKLMRVCARESVLPYGMTLVAPWENITDLRA